MTTYFPIFLYDVYIFDNLLFCRLDPRPTHGDWKLQDRWHDLQGRLGARRAELSLSGNVIIQTHDRPKLSEYMGLYVKSYRTTK